MIAFLVGLLAAGGPLMRGSWDLWSQSILLLLLTAGFGSWLCGRAAVGFLPLPSNRLAVWLSFLACLGFISSYGSPLAAYAVPAWRPILAGLWIFLAASVLSKDDRSRVDQAIRAAAWVLLLLAFYQKFGQGIDRPPSSLVNQNVFAGTILMLLPFSVSKKDWLLTAGLLLVLLWTRSVGAWLGLAGALFFTRRHSGWLGKWMGLALGAACAVAIYSKFQSPEMLHRWQWWGAAARMICDHPLFGSGPGTFRYMLPAYQTPGQFSTIYAHQHVLGTAAAFGIPYTLIWLAGLVHCLRMAGSPSKRFGIMAIFIHSFYDYPLEMPGNLWLFCYLASSAIPERRFGVNIPARYKIPAGLTAAGLAAALIGVIWGQWQSDRLKVGVYASLEKGGAAVEAAGRLRRAAALTQDPEFGRLALEVALRRDPEVSSETGRLLDAAAALEGSARLDPYRSSTWVGLQRLYRDLGLEELAASKRVEGAEFSPLLRETVFPGGS